MTYLYAGEEARRQRRLFKAGHSARWNTLTSFQAALTFCSIHFGRFDEQGVVEDVRRTPRRTRGMGTYRKTNAKAVQINIGGQRRHLISTKHLPSRCDKQDSVGCLHDAGEEAFESSNEWASEKQSPARTPVVPIDRVQDVIRSRISDGCKDSRQQSHILIALEM